jgi:simple sugar transport system permease protein
MAEATSGPGGISPARSVRQIGYQWAAGPAMPLLSLALALAIGALFIVASGRDPLHAYGALVSGAVGGGTLQLAAYNTSETIVGAIPLVFAAVSVAIAFRTGLFNIGAEGQLLVGALAAGAVGVSFAGSPGIVLLPLTLASAAAAGALYGAIPGALKAWRGAHEVITTIMLNYVAIFLMHWLLQNGPMTGPAALGTPASAKIGDGAILPVILPAELVPFSRLHAGAVIAVAVLIGFWALMWKTPLGYELRTVGFSPRAAAQAGIDPRLRTVVVMAIAGAVAGIGGAVQIQGVLYRVFDGFSPGYGFEAIAVALLGKNSPVGIALAALLFGGFGHGGALMQSEAQVSAHIVNVIEALVLFFVAAELVTRIVAGRRRART